MERMAILDQLVQLSRHVGDPAKGYVIYGEGNTSAKIDEHHFYVKASGVALATATPDDFVEMSTEAVLGIVEAGRLRNEEVVRRLQVAKRDRASAARPSIETILHALLIREAGAAFVAHTHPTAVNSILCSKQARELYGGWLLPEHVIFLGPEPLCIEYHDPGLPLAIAIRDGIVDFVQRRGAPPKSVLLQNHGLIVAGATAAEVESMTAMWVKASEILLGTLTAGGPNFLPQHTVEAVLSREDVQHHREKAT